MPVIEVSDLSKRYRSAIAVEEVSFTVEAGEVFGVLGPNGAGKTTTVECIQGLRRPDSGTIRVLGYDPVREPGELRRRIGSQLQEAALPDRLRVWEALDLFASLSPNPTDWRALLDDWGLSHRRKASFGNLSGGERQRLFVALSLVSGPEVVFLDELTQGLDPAARRVAWQLIRQIQRGGTTVVLVTHYLDEAEELCDRVVVLDHGRVLAVGSPQAIIDGSTRDTRVRFSTPGGDPVWLATVDNVDSVDVRGSQVEVTGSGPVLQTVAAALLSRGIKVPDLRTVRPSLEDAYLELTRRADQQEVH